MTEAEDRAAKLLELWDRKPPDGLKPLADVAKAGVLTGFGSATRAELRRTLDEYEGLRSPWVPQPATVLCPECKATYEIMEPEEGWELAIVSAVCPSCQHETTWDLEVTEEIRATEAEQAHAAEKAAAAVRERDRLAGLQLELRRLLSKCRGDDLTAERVRHVMQRHGCW